MCVCVRACVCVCARARICVMCTPGAVAVDVSMCGRGVSIRVTPV